MDMTFRSLKPIKLTEEDKTYASYKKALDHCFEPRSGINNIGIVGDYGTGKSTIIDSYVEDLDKSKYDVIRISMLTLEKKAYTNNIDILKNIIKQVVYKPRKSLNHNILKYQPFKITLRNFRLPLLLVILFLFVFLANRSLFSEFLVLNNLASWPIEILKMFRYLLLIIIGAFFSYQIYQMFLQGIGLRKLRIASTLDAEVKRKSEDIVNKELEYLEYLIYLLKRDHEKKCKKYEYGECSKATRGNKCNTCVIKTLVFVIEDLDRFGNLQVFQQLREVNSLLNERYNATEYKFIYAVGNILFANEELNSNDNTDGIEMSNPNNNISFRGNYGSLYKENAAKFFDFILNIVPVMDSSNSYEYFKNNFPSLVGNDGIADEDLYMLSKYISTPRVLIDVAHDFQMMKSMRKTETFMHSDVKRLYYAILKSTFHNFYEIIHDVFEDLELIAGYFNNKDAYKDIEESRKDEFVKLFLLYMFENNRIRNINEGMIIRIWDDIKAENNISNIMDKHGRRSIGSGYSVDGNLGEILNFANEKHLEYIFSADAFMHKRGANLPFDAFNFTELMSQYYESNNDTIYKIIKHVETERYNDPNKINFSIKEFLDIDVVELGIKEKLLDINDYNLYVTLDYLSVLDASFLNDFNFKRRRDDTFIRKLTDIDTIVSKMRIDKINGTNGLNIYIIKHLQTENKNSSKVERLNYNAINDSEFIKLLLHFSFEYGDLMSEPVIRTDGFDRMHFLKTNARFIGTPHSFVEIIRWFDSHQSVLPLLGIDLDDFFNSLNDTFEINLTETNYSAFMYSRLLGCSQVIKNEETLLHMLNLIVEKEESYRDLSNPVFDAYRNLVIDPNEIPHQKWLSLFSDNIPLFLPLLDSVNISVIRSVYETQHKSSLVEEKIKIGLLSDIPKDVPTKGNGPFKEFLISIYKNDIYKYTVDNIITLLKYFEDEILIDYIPFSEYSLEHFELLRYYREEAELEPLDHKKPWISLLTRKIIKESPLNDFPEWLQFFVEYDPFKIDVLSELALDNDRLEIFLGFPSLYSHTYENIEFAYGFLINEDIHSFKQIISSSSFDFLTLHNDVVSLNQNINLSDLIYDELYRSRNISLKLFEQYMLESQTKLSDAIVVSSQQCKLKTLFKVGRIEINKNNLLHCSSLTLEYLQNNKEILLNSALATLSNSDILDIVSVFNNRENEISCIVSLSSSEFINTKTAISLTIAYLQDYDADDIKDDIIRLLSPLESHDNDINKIVSLLKKGKGQRKVSGVHANLISLLGDKGVVAHSDGDTNSITVKV